MTITVYNYTDDPSRLDKTNFLQSVGTHTGTVRDAVNVVNPDILVQGNVISGNYCKIEGTLNGYYHITEKIVERNNLTILKTRRDAAMTFLSDVMSSPCICGRNTNVIQSDLPDPKYPTLQRKYIETFAMYPLSNDDVIVFAFVE